MHLCDGALAVFLVNDGNLSPNPVHMRLEELEVLDLALAPGPEGHMLAVLSQDSNDNRHVSTYSISAGAASLQPGPWGSCTVDMNASTLIPHPAASAILVLGGEQVSCLSSAAAVHKPSPDFMDIAAWCALDSTMSTGQAWLVGLLGGDLCKLTFAPSGAAAAGEGAAGEPDVGVVQLGRTSTASVMVQVGAHEVFLGSCFGDSQSLELGEGDEPSVEVTATYTSLSPIVDMTVMDLDRQGQSQVVTASGAMGSGSLRVVRSGVGIDEEAVVPLPGITGMWGLRAGLADDHHAFLVQSFSSESSVLAIQEEQLTDVAIPGFVTSAASVHCATMLGDSLLQVTRSTVLLLDAKGSSGVRATWDAPADTPITLADASEQHVLLALQGGRVVLLSVQDAAGQPALNQVAETTMAYEVSSLSLADAQAAGDEEGDVQLQQPAMSLAAVGLWTEIAVHLLDVPSLSPVHVEALGGSVQTRSLLLTQLDGSHYLLAGMGDGALVSFSLSAVDTSAAAAASPVPASPWVLGDKKRSTLGSQPVNLCPFRFDGGEQHVFAACDRPTVIKSVRGRLSFSNVNMSDVALMCPFHTEEFPDCLALATPEELTIGTVDDIQKLYVRTIHLGESPVRVVHVPGAGVLAVGTLGDVVDGDLGVESSTVHVFDDTTFEGAGSFKLQDYEQVKALSVAKDPGAPDGAKPSLILVGTAFLLEGEEEPSRGRLLILRCAGEGEQRAVELAFALDVHGGVMAVKTVLGRVVASCNEKTTVYKWGTGPSNGAAAAGPGDAPASPAKGGGSSLSLAPLCEYHDNTFVLSLEVRANFILVGDLMKSVALLVFSEEDNSLKQVSHDPRAQWLTACAMHDDEHFLVSDSSFNFVSLARNTTSQDAVASTRMDIVGEYHLGEQVNAFAHGSLVMRPSEGAFLDVSTAAPGDGAAAAAVQDDAAAPPTGKRKCGAGGEVVEVADSAAQGPKAEAQASFIFGTVSGSVGAVITLNKPLYHFLVRLQAAMASCVDHLGGLQHDHWRSFYSPRVRMGGFAADGGPTGFIDGDFVEAFLELPETGQQAIVATLNDSPAPKEASSGDESKHPAGDRTGPVTLVEVLEAVEGLARLH